MLDNSSELRQASVDTPAPIAQPEAIVSFKEVSKAFGTNQANHMVSFDVYKNEVHALLGENGAGKSTIMSILFGLYSLDEGEIHVRGRIAIYKSARDAAIDGIAMLPQHFKLIDNMTVLENVVLGREVRRGPLLDNRGARDRLLSIMQEYNLQLDPSAMVDSLSVSEKQRVEILKILWTDAEIIILDEPTSILTPNEIVQFLELVKDLKRRGKTVIIITHKLDEVKQVADRFTILRRGKFVATGQVSETSERTMAHMMVGKQLDLLLSSIPRAPTEGGDPSLVVSDLFVNQRVDQKPLHGVSFEVFPGKILGIAAVAGNGQSELFKVIGGMISPRAGEVYINGQNVTDWPVKRRYSSVSLPVDEVIALKSQVEELKVLLKIVEKEEAVTGELFTKQGGARSGAIRRQINHFRLLAKRRLSYMSHIPEDRHEHGLVLDLSCAENAVLQDVDNYRRFGLFLRGDANAKLDYLIRNYDVRGISSANTPARILSGGNQQKLILGREIERQSSVLLAFSPTRGLDVGSTRRVYEQIMKQRDNGAAVLLYSGELDEIMDISDTIAIMHNGAIVAIVDARSISKDEVGIAMFTGQLPEKLTPRAAVKHHSDPESAEPVNEARVVVAGEGLPPEDWMVFKNLTQSFVPLLPEKVVDGFSIRHTSVTAVIPEPVLARAVKRSAAKKGGITKRSLIKKASGKKTSARKTDAKRIAAKKNAPKKTSASRKRLVVRRSKPKIKTGANRPILIKAKPVLAKSSIRRSKMKIAPIRLYKVIPVRATAIKKASSKKRVLAPVKQKVKPRKAAGKPKKVVTKPKKNGTKSKSKIGRRK